MAGPTTTISVMGDLEFELPAGFEGIRFAMVGEMDGLLEAENLVFNVAVLGDNAGQLKGDPLPPLQLMLELQRR